MKAFKTVLAAIAILICAILVKTKQPAYAAKASQAGIRHDATRHCKKERLVTSPLCNPFRLPY